MRTFAALALSCMLALTACGGSSTGGGDAGGRFAEALTLLPADAELYLTDWTALKSTAEDTDVETEEGRFALMRDLMQRGSGPVVSYEVMHAPGHKEQWGWDLGDLTWEAVAVRTGPPVYVLGFGESFDVSDVESRLQERGFQARDVEGGTLYEHEQDLEAEWFTPGDSSAMSMFNMAVLAESNVIMTASDPAEIEAALADPQAPGDEELTATLAELEDPAMAVVAPGGPQLCDRLLQLPGGGTPAIEKHLEPYVGSEYEAFGYGHDVTADGSSGRIVLRYADAAAAEADVEVRRSAAEQGPSQSAPAFAVDDLRVEGQNIVMDLAPNEQGELRIGEAYLRGELLVASC